MVGLGVAGCAPKSSFLTDQPQKASSTYFFSTLSKGKGRKVERLVPRGGVITRQEVERGWLYIIDDPAVGSGLPRFGFSPLQACEVSVQLERLSDVDGRGVDEGDVRRRDSFERKFEGEGIADAIRLLQAVAADPFGAAQSEAPEAWKTVAQDTQVDSGEVGFVIRATAQVITGNPFDSSSRLTLFQVVARSEYQRARDAEPAPAAEPAAAETPTAETPAAETPAPQAPAPEAPVPSSSPAPASDPE